MLILSTIYRRFFLATLLWVIFWPVFWYARIGEITGEKAWFWIIGELSYPVVALAYILLDKLFVRLGLKPWLSFVASITVIILAMPFYYQRYGFALGVTLEARYL